MQVLKPLDFIHYIKKDAEIELEKKFNWERFQHKHHESRFTRFFEDYWLVKKFSFDRRRAHFSSLILTGQMKREEAIERIEKPELDKKFIEHEFEYIAHKLDLTVKELKGIFKERNKDSSNYRSKHLLVNFASKVMRLFSLEKRLYK
jgi:hypothetical protein